MSQDRFLSRLDWRFATKKFDPTRKIAELDLRQVLGAIRLAPTSNGLQPFHVIVIDDNDLRARLRPSCFGQAQITDASQLLVFCVRTDILKRIDEYVALAGGGDEAHRVRLAKSREAMRAGLGAKTEAEIMSWGAQQTFIALGFALAACAELGIDSCPIGGFRPHEVDALLGLPPELKSVVLLPIGYRLDGPAHPKIRFAEEDLFSFR